MTIIGRPPSIGVGVAGSQRMPLPRPSSHQPAASHRLTTALFSTAPPVVRRATCRPRLSVRSRRREVYIRGWSARRGGRRSVLAPARRTRHGPRATTIGPRLDSPRRRPARLASSCLTNENRDMSEECRCQAQTVVSRANRRGSRALRSPVSDGAWKTEGRGPRGASE